VTRTSFDGGLAPHAFFALTRTKYAPLPTPVTRNEGEVLAVSKFARSFEPVDEPASITYDVGAPSLAAHAKVTVDPDTTAVNPRGAPGAPTHGALASVTTSRTSFDAEPAPVALTALTRMKNVPAPTPVAMKLVVVLPVAKFARSLRPGADPASTL
jgi:hypothetical protein